MSFNFIPMTNFEETETQTELPVFIELARNPDTLEILVKGGNFYYVSKNDAIKIWILKALHKQTARYVNSAYSSDYGNEIQSLFGRNLKDSLLKSELKRLIEEALLVNPYISSLTGFYFNKKRSVVNVNFTVHTIYGDFLQEINFEE